MIWQCKDEKAITGKTYFVARIQLLYAATECLIKVNGSLMAPIPFQRGAHQGCPMSAQLYTIYVEPFLRLFRREVGGSTLAGHGGGPLGLHRRRAPNVHRPRRPAEDVQVPMGLLCYLLCQDQLGEMFQTLAGSLAGGLPPRGDGAFCTTHLLYLGVYLSLAVETWLANWQELETKVVSRLGCWSGLLRVLSY